jgi:hypothetical protein
MLSTQDTPKFTQIVIFGLKIDIPSGNPDARDTRAKKDPLTAVGRHQIVQPNF